MTFNHSNRWIEFPNTRKSIENGFTMKKYVGVVVWKSFQLVIVAEIYHFENKHIFSKKVHLLYASLKNKTISKIGMKKYVRAPADSAARDCIIYLIYVYFLPVLRAAGENFAQFAFEMYIL